MRDKGTTKTPSGATSLGCSIGIRIRILDFYTRGLAAMFILEKV